MFGATVDSGLLAILKLESKLSGDDHLVAEWSQRLAYQLFVDEGAVGLCRIKEIDAFVKCRTDQCDHLFSVRGGTIGKTHSHATQSQRRHLKAADSNSASWHFRIHKKSFD